MTREVIQADAVLDCVGLYCPMPIAHTANKLKEMKEGEVLEVLADDIGILEDMPAWCKMTGNEFISVKEEQGIFRVLVRKSARTRPSAKTENL